VFPPPGQAEAGGLVGVGADLAPGTILAAYRAGIFPWPGPHSRRAWWSPDPRAIIPLEAFHVPHGLARRLRRGCFEIRVDTAFADVVAACAAPRGGGTWITGELRDAYVELHRLGWAHSVEAWEGGTELAGGLYGVAIDGLFAGESMFHQRTDASKVALAALVGLLRAGGFRLLDVQFLTPFLAQFGAVEIPRAEYLERLAQARAVSARFPAGS